MWKCHFSSDWYGPQAIFLKALSMLIKILKYYHMSSQDRQCDPFTCNTHECWSSHLFFSVCNFGLVPVYAKVMTPGDSTVKVWFHPTRSPWYNNLWSIIYYFRIVQKYIAHYLFIKQYYLLRSVGVSTAIFPKESTIGLKYNNFFILKY